MNNIKKQNEDLASYVKDIILKYCPYVDDRLSILGNTDSPQIDIEININNNETQITFLYGNSYFKQSILEQIMLFPVIEFAEISEIIDFILGDHEIIKNLNLYNNSIGLNFAINWTEKSIKGINCGDIGLNLKFNNNIELERQYLCFLFKKYYTLLVKTPSFKKIKNEYFNNVKRLYFNTLDKSQLISFLSIMDENELKEMLYNLDNDTFIKYTTESQAQTKIKNISRKG